MKPLYGQELVKTLRKFSDNISKRLWIAVPYIGNPTSIRRIIGKQWFENPSVSVKLITDTSDITCINTETVQLFHKRGKVKTLSGLHAKIYIMDDECLVTSANLTETAFSRRHEIGLLCNSKESEKIIDIFNDWWKQSENIKPEQLQKIVTKKGKCKEEIRVALPTIFNLPEDPGSFIKNIEKKFLNFDRLVDDYEDFAKKYSSIQRLWEKGPLFLETDGLFNYLFHSELKPSNGYIEKKPRNLTQAQQLSEIKKWAHNYKKWNETHYRKYHNEDDIDWRIRNSKTVKQLLSPNKVSILTKEEVRKVLLCTNSLSSDQRNLVGIFKKSGLKNIKLALNELVNGKGELAARMNYCNKIKHLGKSTRNELIGFAYPERYPLLNKNSISGLRFFGYQSK